MLEYCNKVTDIHWVTSAEVLLVLCKSFLSISLPQDPAKNSIQVTLVRNDLCARADEHRTYAAISRTQIHHMHGS